jgi:hypothetical protein
MIQMRRRRQLRRHQAEDTAFGVQYALAVHLYQNHPAIFALFCRVCDCELLLLVLKAFFFALVGCIVWLADVRPFLDYAVKVAVFDL